MRKPRQQKRIVNINLKVSPVSSIGAKRDYLHDSINSSLADIVKKKFVHSEEFKGSELDGNLEDIDFPFIPADSPIKIFNIPRVVKIRVITPLKNGRLVKVVQIAVLPICSNVESVPEDGWHTGDISSGESPTSCRVNLQRSRSRGINLFVALRC